MRYEILVGDVMEKLGTLADESVHCVVTSPPYWGLRDYGTGTWEGGDADCQHRCGNQVEDAKAPGAITTGQRPGIDASKCRKCGAIRIDHQIGLEKTPGEYIAKMVAVFREVRRVLRSDGTCWVNMGDSYTSGDRATWRSGVSENKGQDVQNDMSRPGTPPGLKPKDLCGMPWRLAFALQADGWWLRQDIIWSKPNPMPESVLDRCTKAHEYLFLLTKSAKYFYDAEAIKERAIADHPAGNTSHKGLTAYEEGDERHRTKQGLVAYASRNGKNSFHGQGSNRDTEQGPANRDGRDMSIVGIGATRNKRSVWEIATEAFPEAHFATFPTKLVEPCILAGTSEKGCCEVCGAPWARMVETARSNQSGSGRADNLPEGKLAGGTQVREDHDIRMGPTPSTETIGWEASCKCGAPTTPCTVLDCFNGSGTTGLVALANRCNYIGIELNPEYAAMSERRLAAATAQGVLV